MKKSAKSAISFVLIIMIISSLCVPSFAQSNNTDSEFIINIYDESGSPDADAAVHLYSFIDDRIVETKLTDDNGTTNITYKPLISGEADEKADNCTYADYLIYVQRSGYDPIGYSLTKVIEDGYVNDTVYNIVLHENEDCIFPSPTDFIKKSTASIAPFTVTRNESIINENINTIESINSVDKTSGIHMTEIPIGTFHANRNVQISVTLESQDKIKVQSAMSSGGGSSIFGSRTRGVETYTPYEAFAPTYAQKITYYTYAQFEVSYTTDSFTGTVIYYCDLYRILGGNVEGSDDLPGSIPTRCNSCNKDFNEVKNDGGAYVTINSDGYKISMSNDTEIGTNLGVDLSDLGFNVSVGISRARGSTTSVTYSRRNANSILIYSDDTSWGDNLHVSKVN